MNIRNDARSYIFFDLKLGDRSGLNPRLELVLQCFYIVTDAIAEIHKMKNQLGFQQLFSTPK